MSGKKAKKTSPQKPSKGKSKSKASPPSQLFKEKSKKTKGQSGEAKVDVSHGELIKNPHSHDDFF